MELTLTHESRRALAQKQLEHYNLREIDGFCDCFHAEVKVMRLISNQVVHEGMAEFRASFQKFFAEFPDLHCEVRQRIVGDHAVVDEEWITGVTTAPPEGFHAIVTYGFRDGLIDRVWTAPLIDTGGVFTKIERFFCCAIHEAS